MRSASHRCKDGSGLINKRTASWPSPGAASGLLFWPASAIGYLDGSPSSQTYRCVLYLPNCRNVASRPVITRCGISLTAPVSVQRGPWPSSQSCGLPSIWTNSRTAGDARATRRRDFARRFFCHQRPRSIYIWRTVSADTLIRASSVSYSAAGIASKPAHFSFSSAHIRICRPFAMRLCDVSPPGGTQSPRRPRPVTFA